MIKPIKIDSVIFDMDGLMFDTERIAFFCWKEAAKHFGYQIDEELFKRTLGANLSATKEIYLQHFGHTFPIEEVKEKRFQLAEEFLKTNGVKVKTGLYEILQFLKENNFKTAVATSTSRERAINLLKSNNVDAYFNCVLCGDEITRSKPDPEIFLKVADKLNSIPRNCIVLEDSEVGIYSAYKAGMIPIMIPDMKEPSKETLKFVYKKMDTLLDVKQFLKEYSDNSSIA